MTELAQWQTQTLSPGFDASTPQSFTTFQYGRPGGSYRSDFWVWARREVYRKS